jgi:cation transport ATPase
MKTLKFFLSAVLAVALSIGLNAQNKVITKTETIKVSGNCGMCESTIEKAAKINGVAKADWNKKTKVLTLVYNPAKVKSDDVQKKIAAVGYDTPKYKAPDKVYNALHSCCKYR